MRSEKEKAMYASFTMTKQRCYNKKCRDYIYYGGRGITVCDRWLESFDNLLQDMGLRPDGMTLERVDNEKGYSKDNCVWASRASQSGNTRKTKNITWLGETLSVSAWERKLGWSQGTLKARFNALNYSVEEAMTKPVRCGEMLEGKAYKKKLSAEEISEVKKVVRLGTSIQKAAVKFKVSPATVAKALKVSDVY